MTEDPRRKNNPVVGQVRFYWQTGCSSCQGTKEFLQKMGVDFESVNLSEQPERMSEVTDRGFRAIPILMDDERATIAQDKKIVAEFLGISYTADMLSPTALAKKMNDILDCALATAACVPSEELNSSLEGRNRPHKELIHHIFRVVESFIEQADEIAPSAGSLEVYPSDEDTTATLVAYGKAVKLKYADWWQNIKHRDGTRAMTTYDGSKPMNEVFERATWHAAHHTRQLEQLVLSSLGKSTPRPLTDELLEGLPMPQAVF